MRRPLVAGNWKMNGTLADARLRSELIAAAAQQFSCEVLLAPPYVHLPAVIDLLRGRAVAVAAQDASQYAAGAYTGDVSVGMLADLGVSHVIVGHSERRTYRGDTDEVVAEKCVAVMAGGLIPVLCVGETLAERDAGETERVVLRQLDAVLRCVDAGLMSQLLLAYEPVWAIGTGRQASPEQAQEVHALLRARLAKKDAAAAAAIRILYGGSVKAGNAAALFAMPDVDGALVGGASLDAQEFLEICALAR